MATSGASIVRDSGKLGVLPDGRIAVFSGGPCSCCSVCDPQGNAVRLTGTLTYSGVTFPDIFGQVRCPIPVTARQIDETRAQLPGSDATLLRGEVVGSESRPITGTNQCPLPPVPDTLDYVIQFDYSVAGELDRATGRWSNGIVTLRGVRFEFNWDETSQQYVVSDLEGAHPCFGAPAQDQLAASVLPVEGSACAVRIVVARLYACDDQDVCPTGLDPPSYTRDEAWSGHMDVVLSVVSVISTPCDQQGDTLHVVGSTIAQGLIVIDGASSSIEKWAFQSQAAHDVRCPTDGSPTCDSTLVFSDPPNPTSLYTDLELPFTVEASGAFLCNPFGAALPSRQVDGEVTIAAALDTDGRWYNGLFKVTGAVGSRSYEARFRFNWNGAGYDISDTFVGMGSWIFPDDVTHQELAAQAMQDEGSCALRLVLSGIYAASGDYSCGGQSGLIASWGCAPYADYTLTVETHGGGGGEGGFLI